MAKNITSFKANNAIARYSKRRILTENLALSKLRAYGEKMLDVLVTHATDSKNESIRIKAADRFLFYTMLQPRDGAEESDNSEAMAQLRSQLSAAEMVRLNEMIKPAMQGLLNDLIAKVKEGEQEAQVIDLDSV